MRKGRSTVHGILHLGTPMSVCTKEMFAAEFLNLNQLFSITTKKLQVWSKGLILRKATTFQTYDRGGCVNGSYSKIPNNRG